MLRHLFLLVPFLFSFGPNQNMSLAGEIEQLENEYQDVIEDSQAEPITSVSNTTNTSTVELHIGPQVTLLGDGRFGLRMFPDMQVTALQQTPTLQLIITASDSTYLVEGTDIQNLTSATKILSPGATGSFDNGYAGISGTYKHTDGTWYGFYHAEDHEGMPTLHSDIPGFYATIGLVSSIDGGESWTKLGPIISSNKPKFWKFYDEQSDAGTGEPGFVVSKNSEYLYAYYTEHSRVDGRAVQVCMARSHIKSGPPLPGTWEKYHNGVFGEPGLRGLDTPIVSGQTISEDGETLQAHVVYSEQLDKYIMVVNVNFWKEMAIFGGTLERSGIYFSYSNDAINWSELKPLIIDNSIPMYGHSLSWEANIIWDEDSSTEGWLVYGYSPRWGWDRTWLHIPHYMVGRRLTALMVKQ